MTLEEQMKQEIALQRKSATYFFYGEDSLRLQKIVKNFAKALFCKQIENSYCDSCNTCVRIEKDVHPDVHLLESLKIEDIRSMETFFYESAYEGGRKVFILPQVQDLRKESANALLKSIEEPGEGTFFLMWGTQKNILPTIKSRSIQIFVPRIEYYELGVSKECYEFFQGKEEDIRDCLANGCSWEEPKNYKNIRQYLSSYLEKREIADKIFVYQALRDFIKNKRYLKQNEKIWFAEEIILSTSERKELNWIFHYCLHLERGQENLEKKLKLSRMLNFPINTKLFFVNFFLQ